MADTTLTFTFDTTNSDEREAMFQILFAADFCDAVDEIISRIDELEEADGQSPEVQVILKGIRALIPEDLLGQVYR